MSPHLVPMTVHQTSTIERYGYLLLAGPCACEGASQKQQTLLSLLSSINISRDSMCIGQTSGGCHVDVDLALRSSKSPSDRAPSPDSLKPGEGQPAIAEQDQGGCYVRMVMQPAIVSPAASSCL